MAISQDVRNKALEMVAGGMSRTATAKALNLSVPTVSRWVSKIEGSKAPSAKKGAPAAKAATVTRAQAASGHTYLVLVFDAGAEVTRDLDPTYEYSTYAVVANSREEALQHIVEETGDEDITNALVVGTHDCSLLNAVYRRSAVVTPVSATTETSNRQSKLPRAKKAPPKVGKKAPSKDAGASAQA